MIARITGFNPLRIEVCAWGRRDQSGSHQEKGRQSRDHCTEYVRGRAANIGWIDVRNIVNHYDEQVADILYLLALTATSRNPEATPNMAVVVVVVVHIVINSLDKRLALAWASGPGVMCKLLGSNRAPRIGTAR
jgi:hypothetical protein